MNEHAEVNGDTPPTEDGSRVAINRNAYYVASITAEDDTLISEPATTRIVGRPFQKGVSGNPAGRPRKGQTLAERLAAADERIARKAIRARDQRLTSLTQVGNRAWENYLAYRVGLPKQAFVMELGETAAASFLMRHNARVVDGEARLVDDNDTPQA